MVTQVKTPQIADSSVTSPKLGVLTAKGDVMTFTTTHARLPVGSNNQVLTADSSQITGLKWANPTTLYANTTVPAGNTVTNTTVETSFTSIHTIPANSLSVGQVIRLVATGRVSAHMSISLTLKVKFGTTVLNTTNAITLTNGITNAGWRLFHDMIVISTGASGSVESTGICFLPATISTSILTNAAPVTINTTNSTNLQISATWSSANVNNSITLRQLIITN